MSRFEIKRNEWKEYFDDFSRRNRSRLVSVEIFSEMGAQKEVRKMPLSGIVFEANGQKNSSVLEIMLESRREESAHLTHFIRDIQSVQPRVGFDRDEALVIEDRDGTKTLLTFERLPDLRAGAFVTAAGAGVSAAVIGTPRDRLW